MRLSPRSATKTLVARRRRLFREPLKEKLLRWLMGTAYACHPKTKIPSEASCRPRPDIFAGVCRDITPERIIAAARRGYFPWCHVGPLKWWTRRERMVLFLGELTWPNGCDATCARPTTASRSTKLSKR